MRYLGTLIKVLFQLFLHWQATLLRSTLTIFRTSIRYSTYKSTLDRGGRITILWTLSLKKIHKVIPINLWLHSRPFWSHLYTCLKDYRRHSSKNPWLIKLKLTGFHRRVTSLLTLMTFLLSSNNSLAWMLADLLLPSNLSYSNNLCSRITR